MNVTRRHLVATGALALGGVVLMRSSSAVAQSADEAGVAKAVEALRQATLGQQRGSSRSCATHSSPMATRMAGSRPRRSSSRAS